MIMDIAVFALFLAMLILLALPLGRYMAKVFTFEKTLFDPVFCPIEKMIYRLSGMNPNQEMNWKQYAGAVLLFNAIGAVVVFLIQMQQGWLPFNPEGLSAIPTWHSALNTAVSFMTNTNWQSYSPESTMSYFTQMVALTVQNFKSAATGIVVAIALIRGLTRKSVGTIGNFWADLVRCIVWVLIPLSVVFTLVLVQQGVIQNLSSYLSVNTLEGVEQKLAMGPVASQEAIKMIGTNGGGFFNANSSHPFENPTPLTNFLQVLSIFLIPGAIVFAFGHFGFPRFHLLAEVFRRSAHHQADNKNRENHKHHHAVEPGSDTAEDDFSQFHL